MASQVAIAGGGIAGLACAIALTRIGADVTVYERSTAVQGGGAIGLHSSAVLALRSLGVDAPVLAAGKEVMRWEFRTWRGGALASWPQAAVSAAMGAPGITVARQAVLDALRAGAAAASVRAGRVVTAVHQEHDRPGAPVTLRLADGTDTVADLVIGADGLRSVVRASLPGQGSPVAYAGFIAFRGVCPRRPASLPDGLARQTLGRKATFGVWPLPDEQSYWVATIAMADREAREADPVTTHRLLARRFARAHRPIPQLIADTPADTVLRTPIYHRVPVAGWQHGRVCLIGDSAHPMLPTTGQGGGQALLDALALADCLRGIDIGSAGELGTALREFESRRLPVVAAIAAEARRLGAVHHTGSPVARYRRNKAMRHTPEQEWVARMSQRAAVSLPVGGPR